MSLFRDGEEGDFQVETVRWAKGAQEVALVQSVDVDGAVTRSRHGHVQFSDDADAGDGQVMAVEGVQRLDQHAASADRGARVGHRRRNRSRWCNLKYILIRNDKV
jgi:hypothetical protein